MPFEKLRTGKDGMSTLTKLEICFSLPVPTILIRIAVWIVLGYRRVRYGYTFRRIKLTQGKYTIVNVEDFEQLNQYKWHYSLCDYAKRTVYKTDDKGRKQVDIYMHKTVCPAPEGMIVDHINRNKLDNRSVNLRPATRKQNSWNRKFKKENKKTRYNGISWRKDMGKWRVRLTVNGRRESFGYYANETEAAKAYDRVAKKYRGEYACLNFPKK